MLARREHWYWQSANPEMPGQGPWSLKVNSEITRWLQQRKIAYRKWALKARPKPGGRPVTDVVFFFTNTKDSRYFASVWGTPAITDAEIKRLLSIA